MKAKVLRQALTARIRAKWWLDSRKLPLSRGHWELYDKIHRLCWRELEDFPNLVRCRDYNDRIQWLKLFDQDPEVVRCSDKIRARGYIRERVGDEHLPKLYQVKDHFSEIDFGSLPEAFIIKTNHDSGTVILVGDKQRLDFAVAERRIEDALSRRYGWEKGEWAYSWIKPKILVEEHLDPEDARGAPPDFKWHCVDGKVRWLQYIFDRGTDPKETIVFTDGRVAEFGFSHMLRSYPKFQIPREWPQMITIAQALARGFKYVRVDTYLINGKVYVGEMTFFPWMGCYKGDGQRRLGQLLDFDRSTYKSLVHPEAAHPACQMIAWEMNVMRPDAHRLRNVRGNPSALGS